MEGEESTRGIKVDLWGFGREQVCRGDVVYQFGRGFRMEKVYDSIKQGYVNVELLNIELFY